jgi:hypothetical protein
MQELTTTGNLVEDLEGKDAFSALFARSELEAALHAEESVGLWFEIGYGLNEETRRLTLELTSADVETMLRSSPGDNVTLALDALEVERLLEDPDVEAHGIRGALAIAVATAAIAAPTSLAASPQVSSQVAPQVSKTHVSSLVANTQITRQVVRPAATAQVKAQVVRTQLHNSLVVKGAGVKLLGRGLAR